MSSPSVLLICLTFAFSACADTFLHSIQQIRDACKQRQNGRCFDCSGTVIIPPSYSRAPFYIAKDKEVVRFYDLRTNRTERIAAGDIVRLSGITEPGGNASDTNPNCSSIIVLSHSLVPDATPVSLRDFIRHNPSNKHIELQGYVHDVFPDDIDPHFTFIVLQDGADFAYLAYSGERNQLPGFRSLCGSLVTVSGITGATSGRYIGKNTLTIAGTNAFRIVRQSPSHRFDALPILPNDQNRPMDIGSIDTRKVSGTVIATWRDDTFLLVDTNGCPVKIELSEPPSPQISECVEAVGYLETDLFHLSLVRASWHPKDNVPIPERPAHAKRIKDLFVSPFGHYRIPISEHGNTLRLTGTVKSILFDEHGRKKLILTDGEYAIPVDCTHLNQAIDTLHEGCLVEITGVCVKDSDTWRPSFMIPRVRGLFLVPRTEADIRILRQPPWWTPLRMFWALGILLTVIIAILIWNATLRALVIRKSRALLKEQAEKLTETLKIDERTRLAAELHDFHSQSLTAISYQVSSARNACKEDPADAERLLSTATHMLKSCRTELRRCLWDLRNDVLNEPDFTEAIRQTVSPVASAANVTVRFVGHRAQISDSTAHAILSILRELVSNAVVHGLAANIRIAGECLDHRLRFSITDDGCGFDPSARPGQDEGHFGLDGIQERLNRIGGTLNIESTPGNGTYIRLTLNPLPSTLNPLPSTPS